MIYVTETVVMFPWKELFHVKIHMIDSTHMQCLIILCLCSSHPVCVVNIMDCCRLVSHPCLASRDRPWWQRVQMCHSWRTQKFTRVHGFALICASLRVWKNDGDNLWRELAGGHSVNFRSPPDSHLNIPPPLKLSTTATVVVKSNFFFHRLKVI